VRAAEKAGALERARACAASYAEAAVKSLEDVVPSKYTDGLRSIPAYILEREM
jgi:geranylgeranyl pyrophosphate synthase